jgi:hypothetical protein
MPATASSSTFVGFEDFGVAVAAYLAACQRWPKAKITLRQGSTRADGQQEVKKGYTTFLSGDVIMAKITPCMENGKTTVVPDLPGSVCFGSTEFQVIRPEAGITARWIAEFLVQHEFRRAAQRAMTGGVGQMRVPVAFLQSVRIPVAPTAEQERINDLLDELLSDLDAGVAAQDRVREKLRLYRASVLKAAVEGVLTAAWRKPLHFGIRSGAVDHGLKLSSGMRSGTTNFN